MRLSCFTSVYYKLNLAKLVYFKIFYCCLQSKLFQITLVAGITEALYFCIESTLQFASELFAEFHCFKRWSCWSLLWDLMLKIVENTSSLTLSWISCQCWSLWARSETELMGAGIRSTGGKHQIFLMHKNKNIFSQIVFCFPLTLQDKDHRARAWQRMI